jgi:mitogen-activated protein kinase 1/3
MLPNCRSYWFRDEEIHLPDKFTPVEPIGQGASSVVFSAADKTRCNKVAIKKLKNALKGSGFGYRALNEVLIMRLLKHENIVAVKELFIPDKGASDLYIVTELIETDLASVLKSAQDISNFQSKIIFYQVMCGLKYMHSVGVTHRDIKPRNILLSASCDVKICDFGLSWFRQIDDPFQGNIICTRWYRPPEILCEAYTHDEKVDVFSAGCVLAEIASRKPLLPGLNEEEQLKLMVKRFGPVPSEDLSGFPDGYYSKLLLKLSNSCHQIGDLESYLGETVQPCICKLIRSMCTFDPEKRLSASETVDMALFADLVEARTDNIPPWRVVHVSRLDKNTVHHFILRECERTIDRDSDSEGILEFPKLSKCPGPVDQGGLSRCPDLETSQ